MKYRLTGEEMELLAMHRASSMPSLRSSLRRRRNLRKRLPSLTVFST